MNNDFLKKESIFKVGRVISIEGRSVKIIVNKNKNTSHLLYDGELLKNVTVGGFVKITKGFINIIAKVEGEFTNEDKFFTDKDYKNDKSKINRILKVSLVGFVENGKFERGIKELPLIDNECYLLEKKEFESIHNFISKGDTPIQIGKLSLESNMPISIGINGLFASHIGIFGNTGSGKSYTLAKLYRQLFVKYIEKKEFVENSSFFFLDFNGEYVNDDAIIDAKYKCIYKLSTRKINGEDKYPITEKHIEDTTFWSIILDATDKTQRPFIHRAISNEFYKKIDTSEKLKGFIKYLIVLVFDKEEKSLMKSVIDFLYEFKDDSNSEEICDGLREKMDFNNSHSEFYFYVEGVGFRFGIEGKNALKTYLEQLQINLPVDKLKAIGLKIKLKYFEEIIKGFSNIEHLSPLIKRLDKRLDDLCKVVTISDPSSLKNISIVSLRDVNIEMRKMLPLLICKELYSTHKSDNSNGYLNIIIDEAHNILSRDSDRESEIWKDYRLETFEEIIKEGRKFGVFLTIASQRPSDISATIISQLHNFFLHRLINNRDIEAIEKSISYLDRVSFEYLPILPTGTCILAGVLVNMPVVIDIEKIEEERFEPDNKTLNLLEKWGK